MELVRSAEPGKDILPEGNYSIVGEPGTGSKVGLDYADTAGIISGDLFPTGSPVDILEMPWLCKLEAAGTRAVFVNVRSLGLDDAEQPNKIGEDTKIQSLISTIRKTVATKVGLQDSWESLRNPTNLMINGFTSRKGLSNEKANLGGEGFLKKTG